MVFVIGYYSSGENFVIGQGLKCKTRDSRCGRYNPKVDAKTLNEFTHSVFRVLHKNIPEIVKFYHPNYSVSQVMKLSDTIGLAKVLNKQYLEVMRGQLRDPALWINLGYPDEVRKE